MVSCSNYLLACFWFCRTSAKLHTKSLLKLPEPDPIVKYRLSAFSGDEMPKMKEQSNKDREGSLTQRSGSLLRDTSPEKDIVDEHVTEKNGAAGGKAEGNTGRVFLQTPTQPQLSWPVRPLLMHSPLGSLVFEGKRGEEFYLWQLHALCSLRFAYCPQVLPLSLRSVSCCTGPASALPMRRLFL